MLPTFREENADGKTKRDGGTDIEEQKNQQHDGIGVSEDGVFGVGVPAHLQKNHH